MANEIDPCEQAAIEAYQQEKQQQPNFDEMLKVYGNPDSTRRAMEDEPRFAANFARLGCEVDRALIGTLATPPKEVPTKEVPKTEIPPKEVPKSLPKPSKRR